MEKYIGIIKSLAKEHVWKTAMDWKKGYDGVWCDETSELASW